MIYCIEDDENIRELILYTLHSTGFEARGFEDADAFYTALQGTMPTLILLDIMLPEKDGLTLLHELRKRENTKAIPVILITAKESEFDKVRGLDLGADDYITKPFGMMEMISRIKAVLRRCEKKEAFGITQFANISLNTIERTVKIEDEQIALSFKEFELLRLLIENPHKVFSRETLLNSIWGYGYYGETRTVDVHIRTLRQKLGAAAKTIQTVRNVGYKMCT